MCRSIRRLYNYEPTATEAEIRAAALQYVRKVSGYTRPSTANETPFESAIDEIAEATQRLLDSLVTNAQPRDREADAARARERARKRYG